MTITERINHLIDNVLDITKKKAAEEMQTSYTTIQNITNGKTAHPKSDVLADWKAARPEINLNWLIAGEGEPLLTSKPAAAAPAPAAPAAPAADLPRDVEVLQIRLQAAEAVIEALKSQASSQYDVIRLMKENQALSR